jgi:S-layer homology domain.
MRRLLNKTISILLTCAMILSVFPAIAFAEEVIPGEAETFASTPSGNVSTGDELPEEPELEEGTIAPMSGIVLFDAEATGVFEKITSVAELAAGDKIVLYGVNGTYTGAMNATISSGRFGAVAVAITGDAITDPAESIIWTVGMSGSNYTLYNEAADVFAEITGTNTSGFTASATATMSYSVTANENGEFSFMNTGSNRGISIYQSDFRTYNPGSSFNKLFAYKLGDSTGPVANTAPTAAPTAGVVEIGAEVTLSAEVGCTIYYTTDGSTPTAADTAYTAPITLSALPVTIKAIAVGNALSDSAVATFTYTEASPITVLEARQKAIDTTGIFVQGIVTYASGRNITIQDTTGGIAIYAGAAVSGLNVGDEITAKGTIAAYGALVQLNTPVADIAVISTGNPAPTPIVKTIAELQAAVGSHALESQLVKLENVYVSILPSTGTTMSITFMDDGGNAIQGRSLINDAFDAQITMGAKVNVVASFTRFNATAQLAGYTSGVEFVSAATTVLPLSSNTADGAVLDAGDAITVTTATPGATIEYNTTAGDFTGTWTVVPAGGIMVAGEPGDNITYYIRAKADGLADATLTISVQLRPSSGTIAEVRERREGALASIGGIVTAVLDSSIGLVSVQDSTGAILMKLPGGATFAAGDPISILNATVSTHTDGAIMLEGGAATAGTYSDGYAVYPITFNDTISPARISALESMLVKMYDMEYVGTEDGMRLLRDADGKYVYVEAAGSFTAGSFYHVTGVFMRDDAYAKLVVEPSAITFVEYVGSAANDAWQGTAVAIFANTLSSGGTAPLPLAASGGSNAAGAELTTNTNVPLSAGGGVGGTTGWNSGQYFQYKLSTEGFVNLKLSVSGRASGTGPRNVEILYSLDGITFYPFVGNSAAFDGSTTVQPLLNNASLPTALDNQSQVYFRIQAVGTVSNNGGVIGSGGVAGFAGFTITGDEIYDAGNVTITPEAGAVPLGQPLVFSNSAGGAIEYRVITADDATPAFAAGTGVTLTVLPATVEVKGTTGRVRSYTYTQAAAASVRASSASGAVGAGTAIALSSTTDGTVITYDMTTASGTSTGEAYHAAIVLQEEDFPVSITAIATKVGYIESPPMTYTYTLKQGGGEMRAYFGQLHAHTAQYSDGAGTLADGLNHIKNLSPSYNVDFLAFTDHSNYFDAAGAANPAAALADPSQMTAASAMRWNTYVGDMLNFNSENAGNVVAMPGFEMTWSGGPGHINTFNTPGIVSRNNSSLNNKTTDAGMQLYYETLATVPDSISQFNHPGTTFGTFSNFSYWTEEYDRLITLIEVGNGEGAIGSSGYFPSYQYYIQALDKGWHLAPTNNQDNHQGNWGNSNTARSVIYTDDFSLEGLYAGMRARSLYATEDHNLEIHYTIDGALMGSIIQASGSTLSVRAELNDPDGEGLGTVELVTNSGRIVMAAELGLEFSAVIEWPLTGIDASYPYYFLRVTQMDKQIAVTAPVWVGEVVKLGISDFSSSTIMPVVGEEMPLKLEVFNLESSDFIVQNIVYQATYLGQTTTIGTVNRALNVPSGVNEQIFSYAFTPTHAGFTTLTAIINGSLGGTPYTLNESFEIESLDSAEVLTIGIDAGHSNFYVSGNYADSDTGLIETAAQNGLRTIRLGSGQLTYDNIKDMQLLVLTVPFKSSGTSVADSLYTAEELAAIARYAAEGGNIILTSKSDRLEPTAANEKASAISNGILAAIGSDTRVAEGIVIDDVRASNEYFRITLGGATAADQLCYNYAGMDSNPLLAMILNQVQEETNNTFSAYNSAPIIPGTGAVPVVSGFATTWGTHFSELAGNSALGTSHTIVTSAGDTHLMTIEALSGGGFLVVAGVTFFSTFEVKVDLDNVTEKQNSNYQLIKNLLDEVKPTPNITSIADVQAQPTEGGKFTVEAIVTSNASGYDRETAFFDCIYIQDGTGGINVFPVSSTVQAGMRVRITGYVSSYQDERQLLVSTIEIIDRTVAALPEPLPLTTATAAGTVGVTPTHLGMLVKVSGTVTAIDYAAGGAVQNIWVTDSSGVASKVFINGYITADKEIANLAIGATVTAVGLASINTEGGASQENWNRIRIRDRADIVATAAGGNHSGSGSTGSNGTGLTELGDDESPTSDWGHIVLPFVDVASGIWYYNGVAYVYQAGLFNGTSETAFSPELNMSRAMMVTVLHRLAGSPNGGDASFSDVDGNIWYTTAVRWAAAANVVNGIGDGLFAPNDNITREQMALMLYNYCIVMGIELPETREMIAFSDADSVSDWAKEAVAAMYMAGVLSGKGDGVFDPQGQATRAEVATMLMNFNVVIGG